MRNDLGEMNFYLNQVVMESLYRIDFDDQLGKSGVQMPQITGKNNGTC